MAFYLRGSNSVAGSGLWFSDGTAQGTYEIGGLTDAGVSGTWQGTPGGSFDGLSPRYIFTFGSKALFFGSDASGYFTSDFYGLWVTDGTAAGTIELGGLKNGGISGAYALGWTPENFGAFGNKALFSALDTDDYRGLWITDGTTAGTYEIGGLKNAGITGAPSGVDYQLDPSAFASIGSKALFTGTDSSGFPSLWVTDGTAQGTFEIGGAHNNPVTGQGPLGLEGAGPTSIGTKALFSGADIKTVPGVGLWITDGTIAGTSEIGGLDDAGVAGASGLGLHPYDITAFGNGKAIFVGFDSTTNPVAELWATDGTAAGTIELGGLGNQGLSGVNPKGLLPSDAAGVTAPFASIGNKVVFEGVDASGLDTLWVTDGTTAGTFEIGGVNNAGVVGAPTGGLLTHQFAAVGNEAYFVAQSESTGVDLGVWVTDGTVAGTQQVAAAVNSGWNPLDLVATGRDLATTNDFNGDGKSDILWRDNASGTVYDAQMNGSQRTGWYGVGGDANWSVVGTGDFNGDGKSDILWRNNASGTVYDAQMNGSQRTGWYGVGGDANWSVVGTGDFNGDGKSDILWRNNASGTVYDAQMNGSQRTGFFGVGGDSNWSVVGTGDFNGDGMSDILWRSNASGAVFDAQMNGSQRTGFFGVGGDANWSVVGTGDFNGDGMSDILWRYNPTGGVFDAQMNGSQRTGWYSVGGDANWSVVGTGDFNGDGMSDILWRNNASGAVFDAQMNGSRRTGFFGVGGDARWSVVG